MWYNFIGYLLQNNKKYAENIKKVFNFKISKMNLKWLILKWV